MCYKKRTGTNVCRFELLSRCLEGTTQNPNEAFNQIVWQKCPKKTFVSKKVLEIGVFSSIMNYNDGLLSFADFFEKLKLVPGDYFTARALSKDTQRVQTMDKKSTEKVKERRRKMRSIRKGFLDQEKEIEGGDSYATGSF